MQELTPKKEHFIGGDIDMITKLNFLFNNEFVNSETCTTLLSISRNGEVKLSYFTQYEFPALFLSLCQKNKTMFLDFDSFLSEFDMIKEIKNKKKSLSEISEINDLFSLSLDIIIQLLINHKIIRIWAKEINDWTFLTFTEHDKSRIEDQFKKNQKISLSEYLKVLVNTITSSEFKNYKKETK